MARAVLIVCPFCKSPASTKGCIVPVRLLGRATSLLGTVVGERLIGGLSLPIKAFLSSPRKAPIKISGPRSLSWNPNLCDFCDFTFLLKYKAFFSVSLSLPSGHSRKT